MPRRAVTLALALLVPEVAGNFGLVAAMMRGSAFRGSVSAPAAPQEPPELPHRFHSDFNESTRSMNWWAPKLNRGSYHYDIEHKRELWVHGKGQVNNWCQCTGEKTDEECHLLSTPAGPGGRAARYAFYPHAPKPSCCWIGEYASGMGPLRPDWMRLTQAKLVGTQKENGRTCSEWASDKPGDWFMMVSDNWSLDQDGAPCFYRDTFRSFARFLGLEHLLTFDRQSFSTAEEGEDVFALPAGLSCEKQCPNPESWCNAR